MKTYQRILLLTILSSMLVACVPGQSQPPTPLAIIITATPQSPQMTNAPSVTSTPPSQTSTSIANEQATAIPPSPVTIASPPVETLPSPTGLPTPNAIPTPQISSAARNTVRIALQSPTSGESSAAGTGVRNGVDLAILQQSKPLIDLGFNVELIPFDDQSRPEVGIANAQAIVNDPASLCVVGHYNSGVTLAAQPLYAAVDLAQISPGSTNPAVTDETTNVWRVVGRDDVQGTVAAQFARDTLKAGVPTLFIDNTPYGRGIAQFFRRDAEVNGPDIVNFTSYDYEQAEIDFAPFLEEISTLNPDLIFFAGSYERAGVFFKQARERSISAQFLGSDTLDNPELANVAGEAVNGMHFTTVAAPVSEFPQAAQFAQDYRARYGQDAPPFSPESYDAATLCIRAIADASRANGGRFPTRTQVLEAMRRLPAFQGISGNYRFDMNGDPLSAGYYVIRVNAQDWNANSLVQRLIAGPPQ
ncbi:MAG: ABC transporter substrate-binding protein [Blastochloris sp.]|nr:ABC transporter substrate-binding protein [Blastochloris sp.]